MTEPELRALQRLAPSGVAVRFEGGAYIVQRGPWVLFVGQLGEARAFLIGYREGCAA
jgi:hypothetical protein